MARHQALRASREIHSIPVTLPPTSNVTVVIGQPNFLICDKREQHKMSDKAEVIKWFAGRKVEVLDDQKGRTTVSAWREQLLNAAGRMSGATGRKMLQGEFPNVEEGKHYAPDYLMNIINDIFKRSKTRDKMNNWFIEDRDGNISLSKIPQNRQQLTTAARCNVSWTSSSL